MKVRSVSDCRSCISCGAEWDAALLRVLANLPAAMGFTLSDLERMEALGALAAVEQLAAGERGIIGHRDATEAFETVGGHSDPGSTWPWDSYLAAIVAASDPAATQ